jgi:hypothetical protein
MGRVRLHFNENDYHLFYHYCANYCRLYDETRKNSIKILLELYKHEVIDIQEHSLDNIFSFFYQKKQEFETEGRVPAGDPDNLMRIRICSDIIAFLDDLEKIYRLLRKKNREANYILVIGVFSKIFEEEALTRAVDLQNTASDAIEAIVSPLGKEIEKKLGTQVDREAILYELVSFTEIFNRLSPDLTFNDEIILLVAPTLLKRFGKEENYEEIQNLLKSHRDQFDMDELESALEGGIHARNEWSLEFSWEKFLIPLRTLNELVAKNQSSMRVSLNTLAALEAPMKEKPLQADYAQLTTYQKPYGTVTRKNQNNQILVTVDNRSHSEVQLLSVPDSGHQVNPQENKYKQYFSVTAGAMVILTIILASIILSFSSPPAFAVGNTTGGLTGGKNGTIQSGTVPANAGFATLFPVVTPVGTYVTPTAIIGNKPAQIVGSPSALRPVPVTPVPSRQYVTIEPVTRDSAGPRSSKILYEQPSSLLGSLYNPAEYITIFSNNMSYEETYYNISFDMKNPPMVIHFTVFAPNITDVKWFEPRDPEKVIDTAVVTRPDESAWFELKIYDENGLYDKQGWGREYGISESTQEIFVRNPGIYHLEFSGRLVVVNSEVLVKKEGNIQG